MQNDLEQRLKRLEDALVSVARIQEGHWQLTQELMNNGFPLILVSLTGLLNGLVELKDEQIALHRLVVSSPVVTDPELRQQLLDKISRVEQAFDQIAAHVGALNQKIQTQLTASTSPPAST